MNHPKRVKHAPNDEAPNDDAPPDAPNDDAPNEEAPNDDEEEDAEEEEDAGEWMWRLSSEGLAALVAEFSVAEDGVTEPWTMLVHGATVVREALPASEIHAELLRALDTVQDAFSVMRARVATM